jgi:hypothetical protein
VISAVIVATTIAGPVLFLLAAVRISPGATLPFYAVTGCHWLSLPFHCRSLDRRSLDRRSIAYAVTGCHGLLRDLHSKLAVIAVIFCQIDALG